LAIGISSAQELRSGWHCVDDDGILTLKVEDPDLEQRTVS